MNFSHFAFFNDSFICGYPSSYFGPSGSALSSFPILGFRFRLKILLCVDVEGKKWADYGILKVTGVAVIEMQGGCGDCNQGLE